MKPSPRPTPLPLTPLLLLGLILAGCMPALSEGGVVSVDEDDGAEDVGDFETPGQCPGGDAAFAALMTQMKATVENANAPGAAIAIVCQGELAHTGAVGNTKSGGAAIDADTRFQLASLTKMFTAASAASLAKKGTIDLDAPISQYIAGLSFGHITLRDLLSHSAGFPTVFDSYQGSDLVSIVNANKSARLWSEPGELWNYSNTGYAVAGAVLESATGRAFQDIVEDEVFAPADMRSATMNSASVNAGGGFAYGHAGSESAPRVYAPLESYYHTADYGPMGGAWGSVTDLAKWAEAHMAATDPLGTGVTQSLRTKQIRTGSGGQGYGLGHFVENSTPSSVHHGGSVTGFLADFAMYPEEGFAVVVLSNSEWLDPWTISKLATDAYLSDLRPADTQPPATKNQIVGTYEDPAVFGTVIVRENRQGLEVEFVDQGITSTLDPWWGDTYGVNYGAEGEIAVSFWAEPGQNASHLVSLYGVAKR